MLKYSFPQYNKDDLIIRALREQKFSAGLKF